ncbi:LicD family protein [Caldifermentibacillus hisashii]|uniref:LicD family protein n=1 Tax=Caldifermentibacillus hisashii TaxID=996558 RepID=UPI002E1D95E5|nr:LicD family protein [Caldifermentibacillus hisashii]
MGSVFKEIQLTPKQLRQLQLIQLEILIEFDRVCRKYGIKYSLDGGTLLGAVRHKGFIPWDDDIDVIMLRSEYEKFFRFCKDELDEKRFFLQDNQTDEFYRLGYSRILRKSTVYRRAGHEHMKYKRGVFIDIFVLDNIPDSKITRKIHHMLCYGIRKLLWSESGKALHPKVIGRKWFKLLSRIPRSWIFYALYLITQLTNKRRTELVGHLTYPYPKRCKYGIQHRYIEHLTELNFEGHSFLATKYYKEYLTDLYGDFMELPPIEKRKPRIHLASFHPVVPQLDNQNLLNEVF